jgi:hypothetical protein
MLVAYAIPMSTPPSMPGRTSEDVSRATAFLRSGCFDLRAAFEYGFSFHRDSMTRSRDSGCYSLLRVKLTIRLGPLAFSN